MGTRSTVKFKDDKGEVILSVYQQYDGYIEGVGAQIAETLKRWVIEGVTTTHHNKYLNKDIVTTNKANGIEDLALLYVMDNKGGAFNMYVIKEGQSEEFDYVVDYAKGEYHVSVYEEYFKNDEEGYVPKLKYKGTMHEFIDYVEGLKAQW